MRVHLKHWSQYGLVIFLHDTVLFGFLRIFSPRFREHQRGVYDQTVRLHGQAEADRRYGKRRP